MSPVVLFFLLGLVAAFLRSELAIPEAVAKAMSLCLMIAIGLKGWVAMAKSGINQEAARLADLLAPKLATHGLLLTMRDIEVIRGDRF